MSFRVLKHSAPECSGVYIACFRVCACAHVRMRPSLLSSFVWPCTSLLRRASLQTLKERAANYSVFTLALIEKKEWTHTSSHPLFQVSPFFSFFLFSLLPLSLFFCLSIYLSIYLSILQMYFIFDILYNDISLFISSLCITYQPSQHICYKTTCASEIHNHRVDICVLTDKPEIYRLSIISTHAFV